MDKYEKYRCSEELLQLDENEEKAYLQMMMYYQKFTNDDVRQLWEVNHD